VEARALAHSLLQQQPGDLATSRLYERSDNLVGPDGRVLLSDSELAAWTGVVKMTEK